MRRRPSECASETSRFYLQPVLKIKSSTWFKNIPIGKNSISLIAKRMAEQAELPGRLTNHSGRHTAIRTLLDNGVAPTSVMQLSGHKRVESLNNYNTTSINIQRDMSRQLSAVTSRPIPSTTMTTAAPGESNLLSPAMDPFHTLENVTDDALVRMLEELEESESLVGVSECIVQPPPVSRFIPTCHNQPTESSSTAESLLNKPALPSCATTETSAQYMLPMPNQTYAATNNLAANMSSMGFLNNAVFNAPVVIKIVPS
jgi:hypothetical protein